MVFETARESGLYVSWNIARSWLVHRSPSRKIFHAANYPTLPGFFLSPKSWNYQYTAWLLSQKRACRWCWDVWGYFEHCCILFYISGWSKLGFQELLETAEPNKPSRIFMLRYNCSLDTFCLLQQYFQEKPYYFIFYKRFRYYIFLFYLLEDHVKILPHTFLGLDYRRMQMIAVQSVKWDDIWVDEIFFKIICCK